ncbi:MAG: SDR family NAD(P)-dependent oxidoreductase [Myxococcales bacterium]|nr:SDR family NAD(P)-dependent oxidoreductase [Myxococcales bacterium]
MHIVITGASSGIGEGLARHLGKPGRFLSLVARRVDLLTELAGQIPGETRVFQSDLSQTEQSCNWLPDAIAAFGPVDVLINNAGVQIVDPATSISAEDGESLLRLNVMSPIRLAGEVARQMLEQGRGTIVNIASVAAITPTPFMAHYSASKAALAAYSEVLHDELAPAGVHVVTVYPGPVRTPMEQAARLKLTSGGKSNFVVGRIPTGTVERLAVLVENAIQRRHRRVIYPSFYKVTWTFRGLSQWITNRFAPRMPL